MGLLLKQFFQLIKLLHSETESHQIAWGIALGFVLGMTPSFSLQTILVFLILVFFKIQMGAAFIATFFFKFVAYLLDPIFHILGSFVLENESLKPLFTHLYNAPIIPWTRFYNSIVMGSGVLSLFLTPFLFFISLWITKKYRDNIYRRFKKSKLFIAFKATTIYQWYAKYNEYYG